MPPPPNLASSNFQEKSSGIFRMQANVIAAEAPPRTPPRELTAFLQTL